MSTSVEITTAVEIKASFDKFVLIKKALLSAPWIPEIPPKKPLNRPPIGSHLVSNFRSLVLGINSIKVKQIRIIDIMILSKFCSIGFPSME